MLAELLSSPTRLAKFFRKSRDAWKARSLKNQKRVLVLDGRVRDLERSRAKWKADAKKARQELAALQQQFAALQHATTDQGTTGKAKGQVSPNARSLIVAPTTTLAPAGATDAAFAAPPFCPRSFTVSR